MKSTDITLLARRVILAATLVLAMTPITAKAQTPAQLFDDVVLQDIYLFMDPADWQKLRDNYLLDTYYPARFVWNGIELGRVGIRSRGSGSRSPEKPNLLVAFNRYDSNQKLFGLASVVLKANNQDASLLREVLAMKLFRRIGLPAPLEAPARLYVNGELFGAYTLVESIDEVFLARNFGEDTGYLYDWQENRDQGYHFEYLGPDPSLYVPAPWDPKTRKSSPDAAFIEAMVRAVNETPDQDFVRVVSRCIDLRQFVVYLATEQFVADYDGFLGRVFGMNNMYWYRFASGDPFVLIPWDRDGAFGWAATPIFEGVEENVLAHRALQDLFGVPGESDRVGRRAGRVAGTRAGAALQPAPRHRPRRSPQAVQRGRIAGGVHRRGLRAWHREPARVRAAAGRLRAFRSPGGRLRSVALAKAAACGER
ncbi:MAG: CotH kinase family protein [Bryobacteraceae bacterium]